jgi:hypothetical protein
LLSSRMKQKSPIALLRMVPHIGPSRLSPPSPCLDPRTDAAADTWEQPLDHKENRQRCLVRIAGWERGSVTAVALFWTGFPAGAVVPSATAVADGRWTASAGQSWFLFVSCVMYTGDIALLRGAVCRQAIHYPKHRLSWDHDKPNDGVHRVSVRRLVCVLNGRRREPDIC